MTILGNCFLGLSAILTFSLFRLTFLERTPGGDAAMSYAWAIIYCFLALWACLLVVAAVIGWQGGFSWVANSGTTRFFLVSGSLLASVIGTGLLIFIGDEPAIASGFLKMFSRLSSIAVPLLLISGAVILLNSGHLSIIPQAAYKPLILAGSMIGLLSAFIAFVTLVVHSHRRAAARLQEAVAYQDKNHQRILDQIDSCDVSKDMVFILVFTDQYQSEDIRTRALAKIKTRPDWQEELIRRLDNGWAEQAFIFMASNEVDNKEMFADPVRRGILNQAEIFRDGIRRSSHSSHFYPERFCREIERVLSTVQRYEHLGVDYRPAMRALRASLEEPTDIEKPPFKCARLLDKWLEDHS